MADIIAFSCCGTHMAPGTGSGLGTETTLFSGTFSYNGDTYAS